MILYFDNLITDIPLFPGLYNEIDRIRDSCHSYRFQSRLDVTKYTLASYAKLKWSKVIIKYELDPFDEAAKDDFEKFVLDIFPDAHIIYGRSDCCSKFKETINNYINNSEDEWVFYAGNNDHPIILSDINIFDKYLHEAQKLNKNHEYVSINYSHFPESMALLKHKEKSYIPLKDTDDFTVYKTLNGDFTSIHILNKALLNKWFCSLELPGVTVKRGEDISNYIDVLEQIIVIPKKEICRHYDGYSHRNKYGYVIISAKYCPPLFIPDGFFNNEIKIRYGYEEYLEGWVNINPTLNYVFTDKIKGTDLKIKIDDIPFFWKSRIKEIDINPTAKTEEIDKAYYIHSQNKININVPNYLDKKIINIKTTILKLPYLKKISSNLKERFKIKNLLPPWSNTEKQ